MLCEICCVVAAVVGVAAWFINHRVPDLSFRGKRVLVTGGGQGIGLAIALEAAKRGAHVTIAARRRAVLEEAVKSVKSEIAQVPNAGTIDYIIMDVTDYSVVQSALEELRTRSKSAEKAPVDVLICSAGLAHPTRFWDTPVEKLKQQCDTNYLGAAYAARAAVPAMLKQKFGRVVFVSSMAGLAPVCGYTGYAPTKAALRALAQALDMECAPRNVRCQVVYPPDVDTPGFQLENEVKPPECHAVSGGSGLFKSSEMAAAMVDGIERYRFHVSLGLDGWMLTTLTAGMEPPTGVIPFLMEVTLGGVLRLVGACYTKMHYIITYNAQKKDRLF